jgi:hypothetical protein
LVHGSRKLMLGLVPDLAKSYGELLLPEEKSFFANIKSRVVEPYSSSKVKT